MLGLLCIVKKDFQDIEVFPDDEFFGLSLGLEEVPSSAILRQRLDEIAKEEQICNIIYGLQNNEKKSLHASLFYAKYNYN
jgi:hypothetical protein